MNTQTFRYFPPGPEEQRTFLLQLLGTIICLALLSLLWWIAPDPRLKPVLLGAGAGVLYLLGRAAWALEKKARHAQNSAVALDDDGLLITDATGQTQRVLWEEIKDLNVTGGRLTVTWTNGQFTVGARELEGGMVLVREVTRRYHLKTGKGDLNGKTQLPTNFIPLDPK